MPKSFHKAKSRSRRHYLTSVKRTKTRIARFYASKRNKRRIEREQRFGRMEDWSEENVSNQPLSKCHACGVKTATPCVWCDKLFCETCVDKLCLNQWESDRKCGWGMAGHAPRK